MATVVILMLCLMKISLVLTQQTASQQIPLASVTDRLDKLETICGQLSQEKQLWEKEKAEWEMEKTEWLREKQQLQDFLLQILEKVHNMQGRMQQAENNKENEKQEGAPSFHHMPNNVLSLQGDRRGPDWEQQTEMKSEKSPDVVATVGAASPLVAHHSVQTRADDLGALDVVVSGVARKLEEMSAELQVLKTMTQRHDLALGQARSSYYIHWGRSSCLNSTETVYSGIMGGSSFNSPGAAVDYLCLPLSPSLNDNAVPQFHADLYGAEYETLNTNPTHENKDPPCAVCHVPEATTIMIPATDVCLPGWTQQYTGFLMSGNAAHVAASEYICVDSDFEDRIGSDKDEGGKLLYYTVTHCGNLPCPPYENLKIVTCAVCSK